MSSEQTIESLTQLLEEALKTGDYKDVPGAIVESLGRNRMAVLNFLETKAPELPSKLKLKVFETLVDDGKGDCVPSVLALYASETNILYIKSMLYQLKNLPYKEVLRALVQQEATLPPELGPTVQRVIGHLKNVFREVFYMEEFIAGVENEKKTHHAAQMMIKEPHPDYLPFLREKVESIESVYRIEAMSVLRELGEKDSLDSLLRLLTDLLEETRISRALTSLLPKIEQPGKEQSDNFIEQLLEPLPWDRLRKRGFVIRIRTNTPPGGFESLMDGYRLHSGSLRVALEKYLKGVYLGSIQVNELRKSKILTYLDNQYNHRMDQLDQCLETMGVIAGRCKIDNFPETLQAAIAEDHPDREMLFLKLFAGYKNESSKKILLDFLQTESRPDHLVTIMKVLVGYEMEKTSEKVFELASLADQTELRKAALNLIGKSQDGPEILRKLLDNPSMLIKVDVLETISNNYLINCLPGLIELNEQEHPNSFLLKLIETFAEFPGDQIGEVVRKYLDKKYPPMIRTAAMRTLLISGGRNRFGYLFEAISLYPDKALDLVAPTMITMLEENQANDELLAHVATFSDLWVRILKDPNNQKIKDHFPFLMSFEWKDPEYIPKWIDLVRELQQDQIGLDLDAKKMLSSFLHQLTRALESNDDSMGAHRQLEELLDKLDSETERVALNGLKAMNSSFRTDLLKGFDVGYDRLIEVLLAFVGRFDNEQALIQALAFFTKLHDPKLNRRIRMLLKHRLDTVSNAARRALIQSLGIKGNKFTIKKVLVVDDSKFYCKQLVNGLESMGFTVFWTCEPAKCLGLLEANAVDLLLLDFQMPDMNGLQVIQEARRAMLAPAVMMVMTTDQRRELILDLVDEGVLQVLVKPFKMEDLFAKIRDIENHLMDFLDEN